MPHALAAISCEALGHSESCPIQGASERAGGELWLRTGK